jgi:hypothetical protein
MVQQQFTLRGIDGLDPLVVYRVPPGSSQLYVGDSLGNSEIDGFTNLGYPIVRSTSVKPNDVTIQTVMTDEEKVLFDEYLYEQDSNDQLGDIIVRNEAFRINERHTTLGNREKNFTGSTALVVGGVNTWFYEYYALVIVPGDYKATLGQVSGSNRNLVKFGLNELWN